MSLSDDERLLKLAYAGTPQGCEHAWTRRWFDRIDGQSFELPYCAECDWWYHDGGNPPRVGDGHELDLDERVRLWAKLGGPKATVVLMVNDDGTYNAEVYSYNGAGEAEADGDTPKAALGTAILAAAGDQP